MSLQFINDHDRCNRYTANTLAKDYFDIIQDNIGAILFTFVDNETFRLYVQENRNLSNKCPVFATSYFEPDMYVNQMKLSVSKI